MCAGSFLSVAVEVAGLLATAAEKMAQVAKVVEEVSALLLKIRDISITRTSAHDRGRWFVLGVRLGVGTRLGVLGLGILKMG
jgi:hypothetical protein